MWNSKEFALPTQNINDKIDILEGICHPNQEEEHGTRTRIMFVFVSHVEINRQRKQLGTNHLENDRGEEILFPVLCYPYVPSNIFTHLLITIGCEAQPS